MKTDKSVRGVILDTLRRKKGLSLGIACAVCGAIAASLYPPLLLGKVIDRLTAGEGVSAALALSYFGLQW